MDRYCRRHGLFDLCCWRVFQYHRRVLVTATAVYGCFTLMPLYFIYVCARSQTVDHILSFACNRVDSNSVIRLLHMSLCCTASSVPTQQNSELSPIGLLQAQPGALDVLWVPSPTPAVRFDCIRIQNVRRCSSPRIHPNVAMDRICNCDLPFFVA
jgi:hypothetical protein